MTKITNPLEKSFLTGEGILVYAVNVGLAVASALPGSISFTHAALFITIITVLHAVSRTLLKITAIQKGIGVAPPVINPVAPDVIASDVSDVIAPIFDGGNAKGSGPSAGTETP